MPDWPRLIASLRDHGVNVNDDCDVSPITGGSLSQAWQLRSGTDRWFLKTAPAPSLAMLEAEADGLRELQRAEAVRVPHAVACGATGSDSYLLLEWLTMRSSSDSSDRQLGELLAQQHRCSGERFGWHRDNTIGATPQHNASCDDWIAFFRGQRLGFQLELAGRNGFGGELQHSGARLMLKLADYFGSYQPSPSLLHGDLWSGNYAVSDGEPVIFDPAVYYGDRETDIAMTRLFGGFGAEFYRAYTDRWPLEHGHERRLPLYQLYHVLNHLNLFGSSYIGRALELMRTLEEQRG